MQFTYFTHQRQSTTDWSLTLRSIDWQGTAEMEAEGQSLESTLYGIVQDEGHLPFKLLFSLFFDDNFTGKSHFDGIYILSNHLETVVFLILIFKDTTGISEN